ncbi:MAG: hypothetical protein HZC24_01370 [Rhodocyclales bacterium]|nr:hypothetical protein [Rhodocyclales bacterium]
MLMLDYQAKPRPHRYGFVALALAVAGLGGLALDYYDVVYALEAAAVEVGALDRVDRANAAPGPRDVKEVRAQVQEIAQANRVLRELSVPWEMLFQAVESAGGKDVTLARTSPSSRSNPTPRSTS